MTDHFYILIFVIFQLNTSDLAIYIVTSISFHKKLGFYYCYSEQVTLYVDIDKPDGCRQTDSCFGWQSSDHWPGADRSHLTELPKGPNNHHLLSALHVHAHNVQSECNMSAS